MIRDKNQFVLYNMLGNFRMGGSIFYLFFTLKNRKLYHQNRIFFLLSENTEKTRKCACKTQCPQPYACPRR